MISSSSFEFPINEKKISICCKKTIEKFNRLRKSNVFNPNRIIYCDHCGRKFKLNKNTDKFEEM